MILLIRELRYEAGWIGLKEGVDGSGYQWMDGSPLDYVNWDGEKH